MWCRRVPSLGFESWCTALGSKSALPESPGLCSRPFQVQTELTFIIGVGRGGGGATVRVLSAVCIMYVNEFRVTWGP